MNDHLQKEVSLLKARLNRTTRLLWLSWIVVCSLLLFSALQAPTQQPQQLIRVRSLRIVDNNNNDVIRLETENGAPLIQLRSLGTTNTIKSGSTVLELRDQNNNVATSTSDFFGNAPRFIMTTLDKKGSLGLGFENSQPVVAVKDTAANQASFLQSGTLTVETTDASKKVVASVAAELPVIQAVDKKGATERTGQLTSVGVGARAGDAVTELRSDGSGAQVLNLTSADGKSSIQMNVANHAVTVKTQKDGNTIPWPQ